MKISDIQGGVTLVSSPQTSVAQSNNPFNIKIGGATQQYIDSGKASVGRAAPDGGYFLNFNDRNDAIDAAKGLLFNTDVYKGLTVDQALKKWSNNGYGGNVIPGLSDKALSDLTPDEQTQVLSAMELKGENDAVPPGTVRTTDFKPGELSLVTSNAPNQPAPVAAPKTGTSITAPVVDQNLPTPGKASLANVGYNLDKLGKDALDLLAPAEKGFGESITAALPGSITGVDAARAAQQKNSQQGVDFVKAMQARKASGQPLSPAQQALLSKETSQGVQPDVAEGITPGVNKTNAQVLEEAGGTLLDIASAGTYSKAATIGEKAFTTGLEKATPTVINTAAKTVDAIAENRSKRMISRVTAAITPKLTPTAYKAASMAGKLEDPTFLKEAGLAPETVQKTAQGIANAAKQLGVRLTDIVKPSASATANVNRVLGAIKDYATNVVKPMLTKNPVPFNFQDLRDAFSLANPKATLDNPAALDTYNNVRERMLGIVANSIRGTGRVLSTDDFNDIWNARKVIDQTMEDELGNKVFDSPEYKGVKAAAQDFRSTFKQFLSDSFRYSGQMDKVNRMNEFIQAARGRGIQVTDEMLPKMREQFGIVEDEAKNALADEWDKHLENMSSLYDAGKNLATQTRSEMGKTAKELWVKSHPGTVGALKAAGKTALKGLEFGLGVGGAYEIGKALGVVPEK